MLTDEPVDGSSGVRSLEPPLDLGWRGKPGPHNHWNVDPAHPVTIPVLRTVSGGRVVHTMTEYEFADVFK